MEIYVRTVWSDYEKINMEDLQHKIDYEYGTYYKIDKIDNNIICICRIEEDCYFED